MPKRLGTGTLRLPRDGVNALNAVGGQLCGAQELDAVRRNSHQGVDDRAGHVHLLRIEHELLGEGSDDHVLAAVPRFSCL
jgi:hypothetical protein